MDINTTTDWMVALAKAATGGPDDDIFRLEQIARGWVQPQEETNAQLALIEAILELRDVAGIKEY